MMLGRFRRLMGMMMNRTGRKSHTYNGNTKKIQPLFHIQFISIKLDKKRLLRISTTFVELETLFSIFNFTKDYTNIYK